MKVARYLLTEAETPRAQLRLELLAAGVLAGIVRAQETVEVVAEGLAKIVALRGALGGAVVMAA